MFLKNKNITFKIRRSKVTDYAALRNKKIRNRRIYNFCVSNDGLVKYLLKISNCIFIACDEIPKRHFNATVYATR